MSVVLAMGLQLDLTTRSMSFAVERTLFYRPEELPSAFSPFRGFPAYTSSRMNSDCGW